MKLKKTIIALLLALVTVMSGAGALAAEAAAPVSPTNVAGNGIVSPLAEEKVWCTRVYNGWLQKRQWSLTYERWLTDWINVCPVIKP